MPNSFTDLCTAIVDRFVKSDLNVSACEVSVEPMLGLVQIGVAVWMLPYRPLLATTSVPSSLLRRSAIALVMIPAELEKAVRIRLKRRYPYTTPT